MPYSHPRLCITTVRPTAHDATNVVIEEAEQELSVRLPYWRLNCIKIDPSVDFFFIVIPVPLTCWQAWESSLADHVSFSEESTTHHLAMFETSSNAGAWCYFMMHTLYAWCVLTLSEVRPGHAPFVYVSLTHTASKTKAHESSAVVNRRREWARDRLMLIGTKLGNRAKNNVLCMYP
jgi:hypothetical protein